jgi:hypothetical protein
MKLDLGPNHVPAIRVPKGGSSCATCKFLAKNQKDCTNEYFIKWHGSELIPAPIDSYCSDWYEPVIPIKDIKNTSEEQAEEKISPGIHLMMSRLGIPEEQEVEHEHKRGHGFHSTHIQHHKDGSHTIHHMHDAGPEHDVKAAVGGHDEMLDHLIDHTSPGPNPGEAEANAGPVAGATPAPVAGPMGM